MKTHDLKCWPTYFEEIAAGRLTFSIRDNHGRGFQKGDVAKLREFDPDRPPTVGTSGYTGRYMLLPITYVESAWGVSPGHVVLAFGNGVAPAVMELE